MLLPMKNYSRLGENEKNGIVQVKQIDFDSFSETLEKSQIVLNWVHGQVSTWDVCPCGRGRGKDQWKDKLLFCVEYLR